MASTLYENRLVVLPEWIDHNGHMNVAYYVLAFDEATDAVYEHWGVGLEYPGSSNCSVFTLGMNVDYLGELFEGDPILVTTQLVDVDGKRIHYFHRMFHADTERLVATNECLCMNVDLATRRSVPFPPVVSETLRSVHAAHEAEGRPDEFGRTLQIRRK